MKFSYTISEEQFLAGAKLYSRSFNRTVRKISFWVFIIVCLISLGSILWRANKVPAEPANSQSLSEPQTIDETAVNEKPSASQAFVAGTLPYLAFVFVWGVFVYKIFGARRKIYRENPAMQGLFTVEATHDGIDMSSTAGFTYGSRWSLYKNWLEKDDLVMLLQRSRAFVLVNLAGLTESEKEEFRSIIGSVLPKG